MIISGRIILQPANEPAVNAAVVAANFMTNENSAVTDSEGRFTINIPDAETQIAVAYVGLASGAPYDVFTIPNSVKQGLPWNINLQQGAELSTINIVAQPDTTNKKPGRWLAGLGVLALLLLLLRKKDNKKRK
jgi:hypothetical protein